MISTVTVLFFGALLLVWRSYRTSARRVARGEQAFEAPGKIRW